MHFDKLSIENNHQMHITIVSIAYSNFHVKFRYLTLLSSFLQDTARFRQTPSWGAARPCPPL